MVRNFNYLYIRSSYKLPDCDTVVEGLETIENGDCPRVKAEADALALELARDLAQEKNATWATIKLFHSDYPYDAKATYIRQ